MTVRSASADAGALRFGETMTQTPEATTHEAVMVPVDELVAHPRNYRAHPAEQLDHIRASLRANGVYRNVVAASDKVLLAGHGVVEAARLEGITELPVVLLPFPHNDPRAERVLIADNELSRLAVDDDAQLAALLADVQRTEGLEGTGYDDAALDALIGELAREGEKAQGREFDENLDVSGIPMATCPKCGHEFPA